MNKLRLITTAVTLLAICVNMIAPIANAVAEAPGQALEISPTVLNLTADPGENIEAKINLRDIIDKSVVVSSQLNDFTAKGDDGTPELLLDEGQSSPYALKQWIDPIPEVTLKPKQVQSVPVTIRVPTNAAPGGYYAVVRYTTRAPEIKDTGVALSLSLGTLIFLRVNGDAKEELAIENFYTSKDASSGWLFEAAPVDFSAVFKNSGNVHEQPTGQIVVTDMFNNKVATVNVNLQLNNILPGSTRKFTQALDSAVIGDKILFGQYKAEMKVTYGASGQTLTSNLSFWVIPWRTIIIVITLLVSAFFAIRYGLRRYNDRIISRSRGRRRRR
ncbi:MAG: hypothetical protein WBB94_02335 [Candidatus Saccharimonadaceae bacterium]